MPDPIVLDIEASGLASDSYPIQIAVLIDGKNCYQWTIRPVLYWQHWDDEAEALHGFSRDHIEEHGLSVFDVARELNELLAGTEVYCDALPWDSYWLHRLFQAAVQRPSFELLAIQSLLNPDQYQVMGEAFTKLSESGDYQLHRADEDVKIIYHSYMQAIRP